MSEKGFEIQFIWNSESYKLEIWNDGYFQI